MAYAPLVYPVFLEDPAYDAESDCFFCGRRILACPVFDEGAASVCVTLPCDAHGWRLRGEGAILPGGMRLSVPCLPEDLPVWFTRADPA